MGMFLSKGIILGHHLLMMETRYWDLSPTFSNVNYCEVIMMVGLPASRKTTWGEKCLKDHPEKRYVWLGTNHINKLGNPPIPGGRVPYGICLSNEMRSIPRDNTHYSESHITLPGGRIDPYSRPGGSVVDSYRPGSPYGTPMVIGETFKWKFPH
ncbi:hypothetical protein Ddye_019402 [Dipteronia dyeriana]|uniref:Uncharacterized protein n=1 Tax=Dipteronia dyeriana TaxID=168575 RepID=A0AAD9WVQ0_9ROSI|nr:hypothetical protein Ddye_019402 [Dipteronia dyeriana]